MASLQPFVPAATCPRNSTSWTLCDTSREQNIPSQISVDPRGLFVATYPWDMHPQHFHVCANVVILSLLHVPTTVPTTCRLSVHYKSFSVAPTWPATWPLVSGHLFLFFAISATILFLLIHGYYQNLCWIHLSYGRCAHDTLQFDINPVALSNQKKKFNFGIFFFFYK